MPSTTIGSLQLPRRRCRNGPSATSAATTRIATTRTATTTTTTTWTTTATAGRSMRTSPSSRSRSPSSRSRSNSSPAGSRSRAANRCYQWTARFPQRHHHRIDVILKAKAGVDLPRTGTIRAIAKIGSGAECLFTSRQDDDESTLLDFPQTIAQFDRHIHGEGVSRRWVENTGNKWGHGSAGSTGLKMGQSC